MYLKSKVKAEQFFLLFSLMELKIMFESTPDDSIIVRDTSDT